MGIYLLNMESLVFPEIIFKHEKQAISFQDLFFYKYTAPSESVKNKIIFKINMFNFILSGYKTVYTLDKSYQIDSSQSVIIKNGNCLTTEKFSKINSFNSLTFYFDSKYIQDFIVKFSKLTVSLNINTSVYNSDVYIFEKDAFIENYLNSVELLIAKYKVIPHELTQLKLEEILLYLLQKQGTSFYSFISNLIVSTKEIDFRIKMGKVILNKLTLEEMAFLCNMSLSTFKRNFLSTFGYSPQKWFQKQRLQLAYDDLKNNTRLPSDIYLDLGYSSLSSFSVAFTNEFGISPNKVKQL